MKIAITAESTIDLTPELLEKYDIQILPFSVILGDEEHLDGEITPHDIYEYVSKTKVLPKTAAINGETYKEFFEKVLKKYDAIVHFSLSSGISSACRNAQVVASEYDNVFVVDTKSLSTGIALLAIYARELAQKGASAEEVFEKVSLRIKDVQTSFVISKLDYMYKGGRCSGVALFGANLLKIRPCIALKDGKMGVHKKYIGKMEKVIATYSKDILTEFNKPDKKRVFITYSTATPEMIEQARKAVAEIGFEEVYETTAGSTITSHCGDNTLGILYINDGGEV